MSCDFNKDTLEAYTLSLLDGDEKKEATNHVGACSGCKAFVMQRRQTIQALNGAFNERPPEWLVQKTVENLKHRKKKLFAWRSRKSIPVYMGIAAVILAMLFQSGLQTGRKQVSDFVNAAIGRVNGSFQEKDGRIILSTSNTGTGAMIYQTSKRSDAAAKRQMDSSFADRLTDGAQAVFGLYFENPAQDRTIYKELGVTEEVASLLL
jgi:hypothetical protein